MASAELMARLNARRKRNEELEAQQQGQGDSSGGADDNAAGDSVAGSSASSDTAPPADAKPVSAVSAMRAKFDSPGAKKSVATGSVGGNAQPTKGEPPALMPRPERRSPVAAAGTTGNSGEGPATPVTAAAKPNAETTPGGAGESGSGASSSDTPGGSGSNRPTPGSVSRRKSSKIMDMANMFAKKAEAAAAPTPSKRPPTPPRGEREQRTGATPSAVTGGSSAPPPIPPRSGRTSPMREASPVRGDILPVRGGDRVNRAGSPPPPLQPRRRSSPPPLQPRPGEEISAASDGAAPPKLVTTTTPCSSSASDGAMTSVSSSSSTSTVATTATPVAAKSTPTVPRTVTAVEESSSPATGDGNQTRSTSTDKLQEELGGSRRPSVAALAAGLSFKPGQSPGGAPRPVVPFGIRPPTNSPSTASAATPVTETPAGAGLKASSDRAPSATPGEAVAVAAESAEPSAAATNNREEDTRSTVAAPPPHAAAAAAIPTTATTPTSGPGPGGATSSSPMPKRGTGKIADLQSRLGPLAFGGGPFGAGPPRGHSRPGSVPGMRSELDALKDQAAGNGSGAERGSRLSITTENRAVHVAKRRPRGRRAFSVGDASTATPIGPLDNPCGGESKEAAVAALEDESNA